MGEQVKKDVIKAWTHTNILELIEYPHQGVLSKDVVKEGIDCTLFCMASGTELSEHTSTRQGILYVIEGHGVCTLEGKDIEMKKGVLIHIKENAVHSLQAKENTSFLLFLNKTTC